jgi:GTPase SAR1 family protein
VPAGPSSHSQPAGKLPEGATAAPGKNLWEFSKQQSDNQASKSSEAKEMGKFSLFLTVSISEMRTSNQTKIFVFCGDKQSGKTSLIHRLLEISTNSQEAPKETVALDF